MVGTGKETLMLYYSVAKENVDGIQVYCNVTFSIDFATTH